MEMGYRQWICITLVVLGTTLVPIACSSAIASSTFEEVKARGKMIAGVRYDSPPFGSLDSNGKVVGFDIDLINDIAKRLGVGIELVQVTAKTRIPTLESGKIDIIAA